jgi:hypothetical protein
MFKTIFKRINKMLGNGKQDDLTQGSFPDIYCTYPPINGNCECCGRFLSQLKPFNQGDRFDGCLLVARKRFDYPPNEELDKIVTEFLIDCETKEDYDKALKKLIERYGHEETERIKAYEEMSWWTSLNWECRDCFRLSDERYFRLRNNLYKPYGSFIPF